MVPIFIVALMVLTAVLIAVRQAVYAKKISAAFRCENYDGLNVLILKRYMFFGAVVFKSGYCKDAFKYVVKSGKLFEAKQREFIEKFPARLIKNDIAVFMWLKKVIEGNADYYPDLNGSDAQTLRVFELLRQYNRRNYEAYLESYALTGVDDVDLQTLLTVLAQRVKPDVEIPPELQKSKYYNLLSGAAL